MNALFVAAVGSLVMTAGMAPMPGAASANATCSATITSSLGSYNPLTSPAGVVVRPASVRVTCGLVGSAAGHPIVVTVDIQPSPGGHVMRSAYGRSKPLKYDVYLPDGRIWGDGTSGTGHLVTQFTSSGTQVVPAEIHIAGGQDAGVGRYSDATLTFAVSVTEN
ncbi:MAG TPA: spore coat protein U domain-containing protein [Candidatus Elarobacter sp.]|nr:spore coat protein U domain-containing protein [Candidatus Elarobacter sp.]